MLLEVFVIAMNALKCDFCGGKLIIDSSREFASCEFCGTKYMRSTLQQKIQEIHGFVKVEGDVTVRQTDFIVRAGVLEKYNGSAVEIIIPNNVSIIGIGAFSNCKGLRKVVIPNTVTTIEQSAFLNCTGLKSINIPNSVSTINGGCYHGEGAFENCIQLSSIIIPNSIHTISSNTFKNCSCLENLTIQNGVQEIGYAAFQGCTKLQSITIPQSVQGIYRYAFSDCINLQSIILQDGIIEISSAAFYGCKKIQRINIPDSVEKISSDNSFEKTSGTFENCSNLHSVTGNIMQFSKNFDIIFKNTPFLASLYRSEGKCQYCGGIFKGLIKKTCSKCGKQKDY